jgi:uncharacterized protein
MGAPVTKWQILSKDPESATRFYTSVFGWTVNSDNALGYRELRSDRAEGINGGIWPCPPEGKPMVQLFIDIPDIEGTIRTATSLGAEVIIPPQELPAGERMAILSDPEGISFGLVQPPKAQP